MHNNSAMQWKPHFVKNQVRGNFSINRFHRPPSEAQKPKTFRIAAFYAQKFSGRSAWLPFSRHIQQARNSLSRRTDNERKCLSRQYIMHFDTSCDSIETVQIVLKPSGQYWNCPYSIETVQTELKPSGQYWNRPDRIKTVRTVLKPSGQYWSSPDSIETVRTVLKPSGQN